MNYRFSQKDTETFKAISDPDSRAFVILMTELGVNDLQAFIKGRDGLALEHMLEQLEQLEQLALQPYGLTDAAQWVHDAVSILQVKREAHVEIGTADLRQFASGLQVVADAMRAIDGEGGYMGGGISYHQRAKQEKPVPRWAASLEANPALHGASTLPEAAKKAGAALRETLGDSWQLDTAEILPKMMEFCKHLSLSTLMHLHDYARGMGPLPANCEQVFGKLPSRAEGQIKPMLLACIVRDPKKGLRTEADMAQVERNYALEPKRGFGRGG